MANSRLCSIETCDNPHYGKGFCQTHYMRLRNHGDPLGGATSKGELLRWIHEEAMHHSGEGCLTWPYGKSTNGYGRATIDGKRVNASRYVCELANGAPPTPKHHAAHSCGKGHEACVAPGHLSWKTGAENAADKVQHGTDGRGGSNPMARLTEDDVRAIRGAHGARRAVDLATEYNIAASNVYLIWNRGRWGWLS